jgi:AraC-like DNA-binding protein
MKPRYSLFLLLLLPLALFIYESDSCELPLNGSETYEDRSNGGSSEILLFDPQKDSTHFIARLGGKAKYPVATLSFHPDRGFWDLSSYDYVEVKINQSSSDFNFTFLGFEQGFSDREHPLTHRYYQIDWEMVQDSLVRIPFDTLATPSWWYSSNSVGRNQFGAEDYSALTGVVFSNHPKQRPGDTLEFKVYRIVAKRNHSKSALLFALVLSLLGVAFLLRLLTGKQEKQPITTTPFSELPESRENTILKAIEQNYSDSSLTQEKLSKAVGISEYHIRTILKESRGSTFNDYLKQHRIAISKQLLRETDLDIKEIAYRTGFSHPSAFTRSFKAIMNQSPSQFRSQKS